jgi:hypothetical protein
MTRRSLVLCAVGAVAALALVGWLLLVPGPSRPRAVTGTITAVDSKRGTVQLTTPDGATVDIRISSQTQLERGGVPARVEDLRPGDRGEALVDPATGLLTVRVQPAAVPPGRRPVSLSKDRPDGGPRPRGIRAVQE